MHPQNTDPEKDVDPDTGKSQRTEQEQDVQAREQDAEQRKDRKNSIGSDNQVQERRGTNLDKF